MIIVRYYACVQCRNAWQIGGNPEEIRSLLFDVKEFFCITPLCQGVLQKADGPPAGFTVKEVPLYTFYRALNGFGSEDGEAATLEKFCEILKTKKIISVAAEKVGTPERVILRTLIMEDGTRLHFDTSSLGACCYYIEQANPLEVFSYESNMDNNEAAAKGSDTDREETRRTSEVEDWRIHSGNGYHESIRSTSAFKLPGAEPVSAMPETSDVSDNSNSRTRGNGINSI